jgi:SAM-dependent methyltransferase
VTRLYLEHADLYDLAFGWDVSEEVDWLRDQLGGGCRSVLEPGCGSGRMMEALARSGLDVVGIDLSPAMVELARRRLAVSGLAGDVVLADIADFELGRLFDGAVCPISTLAHLSPTQLSHHLERMARHLRSGARYLVQLALYDPSAPCSEGSSWEIEGGGVKLAVRWTIEEVDVERAVQRQRSRMEILAGERAGDVIEEVHTMTAWTPVTWNAAIRASRFDLRAVHDGGEDGWPRVEPGTAGGLLWHVLTLVDE